MHSANLSIMSWKKPANNTIDHELKKMLDFLFFIAGFPLNIYHESTPFPILKNMIEMCKSIAVQAAKDAFLHQLALRGASNDQVSKLYKLFDR